jgi:nuclear pore complex protein Nup133
MFAQSDAYSGYLDKFFARYPHASISWIHHLDKKRYGDASTSLLAESREVVDLETKHVSNLRLPVNGLPCAVLRDFFFFLR